MTSKIHPTAIVDPGAQLGSNVEIGPYCTVGAHVKLGDGVRLISHVVIDGYTTIGPKTVIYPFASIGLPPQDLKFKGEKSTLEIGANNQIREHVTMNPGTQGGGMVTRVGDNCLFMVGSHVAHDCTIGNNVILANGAALAGHVTLGDFVIVGGHSAVQQFVRIGEHAMIGGMSAVAGDVIPYGLVKGNRAHLAGLNLIGLERRGFGQEDIRSLRNAYRLLFAPEGTMAERLDEVARLHDDKGHIGSVVDFIRAKSRSALCQPQDVEDKGVA